MNNLDSFEPTEKFSSKLTSNELKELMLVSMDALIQDEQCLSLKELKSKNLIYLPQDFLESDVFKQTDLKEYMDTGKLSFAQDNELFKIPCFEEGTICYEQAKFRHYFYFKLVEKEERNEHTGFRFNVQAYCKEHFYYFICSFNYQIVFDKESNDVSLFINNQKNFKEYVQNINFSKSNLALATQIKSKYKSEEDMKQIASNTKLKSSDDIDVEELISSEFMFAIQYINATLYLNKVHAKGNKRKNNTQYIKANKPQPKRIYREAGKIKFHSSEIPKYPTKERIVKYKCLSWQQRGHIRRLKDGREIYVKPCVKHRSEEALSNNIKPANVTINF